jgi:hypothetical protein
MRIRTMGRVGLAIAGVLVGGLAAVESADAASRQRGPDRGGYVVAESRWGHGTVRGAVRPSARGWQVRLPGGTWVDCVRNRCSETLRLETVDVFERMEGKDGGPNYFRFERRF